MSDPGPVPRTGLPAHKLPPDRVPVPPQQHRGPHRWASGLQQFLQPATFDEGHRPTRRWRLGLRLNGNKRSRHIASLSDHRSAAGRDTPAITAAAITEDPERIASQNASAPTADTECHSASYWSNDQRPWPTRDPLYATPQPPWPPLSVTTPISAPPRTSHAPTPATADRQASGTPTRTPSRNTSELSGVAAIT